MTLLSARSRRTLWLEKYTQAFELGFQSALAYRVNFLISLISAAYPIFIQTFLWTAIYGATPGAVVYGFSFRQMIAYTFMAGLVMRLVRTGFEYEIMDDVKSGKFSRFLVQPLGYFPYRIFLNFGEKLPGQLMIAGILAVVLVVLNLFWGISIDLGHILLFLLVLALAVALNFLIFYCFSAVSFWIVEVGFLFEGIRIVTVLLSGGIFPLDVFGETFVTVSNWLPFKYTVYYPIQVLNGSIELSAILQGMLVQIVWIALCWLIARGLWRQGSRRYVAVGG
jgi:ABC-2 type transport system permease protein